MRTERLDTLAGIADDLELEGLAATAGVIRSIVAIARDELYLVGEAVGLDHSGNPYLDPVEQALERLRADVDADAGRFVQIAAAATGGPNAAPRLYALDNRGRVWSHYRGTGWLELIRDHDGDESP